jgi:excisionase family DNA binding protein
MSYDGDVKWVPVRTAAQMLQVSMTRVYQLVGEGTILSIKLDGNVLVSRKSVEAYSTQRELPLGVKHRRVA